MEALESFEGKLKRIKNFLQSSTDQYRLVGTDLQISKVKKNGAYVNF